jgi:hypothetical protein
MSAPRSLLDEVLPRFDANEVHQVWVPARRRWFGLAAARSAGAGWWRSSAAPFAPAKRREISVRRRSWL